MSQKTAHRSGETESDLLKRLLSAVESDSVSSVELNVNYVIDADEAEPDDVLEPSRIEALEGEGAVEVENAPTPGEERVPEDFTEAEQPEDAEEEVTETPVGDEEAEEQDSGKEDTSPVTRNTKEEAVLLALDQLGESTSTQINEVVGFTSSAKASSTLIRLEDKDMVVRSDAPAGSACQYAFDLSARGRDWIESFGRDLRENKYYTGDGE